MIRGATIVCILSLAIAACARGVGEPSADLLPLVEMSRLAGAEAHTGVPEPVKLPIPIAGRAELSSDFGRRGRGRMHKGIDLAAPIGAKIVAPADGLVSAVRWDRRGYGRYVSIHHGDSLVTLYAHMRDTTVKPGQRVKRGQVIGHVGRSGNATGPHLHLEVHHGGKLMDPKMTFDLQDVPRQRVFAAVY